MKSIMKNSYLPILSLLFLFSGQVYADGLQLNQSGESSSIVLNGSASASDNLTVNQSGSLNDIILNSDSDVVVAVVQEGESNLLDLDISGHGEWQLLQSGLDNTAVISASGTEIIGSVSQVGENNTIISDLIGSNLRANISQHGAGNEVDLQYSGSNSNFDLLQRGNGNRMEILPSGSGLNVVVEQIGDDGSVVIN